MPKRYKMNNRKSKKLFTKTAVRTNPKNVQRRPQRGGIRL